MGKFLHAFRGIWLAVRTQNSFWVHLPATVAVLLAAWYFELRLWQWCVILLCIAMVLVAETFNTALEQLAKAIDTEYNPRLRDALDLSSGAVLIAAIAAIPSGLAFAVVANCISCSSSR